MWERTYRAWLRGETAQPLRPLLEWLGRCPLLVVLQALPVVIVWGGFGELGLPGLFFHDVPRVTFVAAFMAAMLLGQLCFIGYLLDADEPWALAARRGKPGGVPPSLRWYLFRTGTYPTWLLALSVPCLVDRHFVFLFGVLAAVGAMVLLTRGVEWLQQRYTADRQRHRWMRRIEVTFFRRRPTHLVVLHVLQAGLLGLFALGYVVVAAYVAWRGPQGWVSPAVVICVAVGLVGAVYGAIRFFFPLRHMGALIAMAVGVVFVGRGCADASVYDELSLEEPPAYAGASLMTSAEAGLLEDEAVLTAWLEGMRRNPPPGAAWRLEGATELTGAGPAPCAPGPKPRLALVATSGGGIRAAAWTAHVLSRLEGGVAGFHRYVRLMTGASGGMVGAGAWAAGLEPEGSPSRAVTLPWMMQQDSLSSAAVAMMLPFGESRGRALESAWAEYTQGVLGRSFEALRAGEAEGWRPSLVYSPMLVEDGRRLLVSNLDLSKLTTAEASSLVVERQGDEPAARGPRARLSLSGVQLFQLFPRRQEAFTVAAAARMSASFPYVSPASALPTQPRVRVVDAGYYDNYGVALAALWLHAHRDWLRACTSGVMLLQVRDHLGNGRRTRLQVSSGAAEFLGGLTSPMEAVLRARESSMSFRNDELLGLLEDELNTEEPCFFTTTIFEFAETAPLSWALTQRDVAWLERAASSAGTQARVDAVRDWLTSGPVARAQARARGLCPGGRELSP